MTYLLFAGDDAYRPGGGVNDFICRFDTEEQAVKYVHDHDNGFWWAHITDDELDVVLEYGETVLRNVYPNPKNKHWYYFRVWRRY
jgi:hypothetical protein